MRSSRTDQPVMETGKIVFGQVVPCDKCKRTGTYTQPVGHKKVPCVYCDARGYRPWRTDAVDGDTGASE